MLASLTQAGPCVWTSGRGGLLCCADQTMPDGGGNSCPAENPWQKTALATKGIAGDMFWQYGDTLPSCNCKTAQDGNTVYVNGTNWDCMVTQHVAAIRAVAADAGGR